MAEIKVTGIRRIVRLREMTEYILLSHMFRVGRIEMNSAWMIGLRRLHQGSVAMLMYRA